MGDGDGHSSHDNKGDGTCNNFILPTGDTDEGYSKNCT